MYRESDRHRNKYKDMDIDINRYITKFILWSIGLSVISVTLSVDLIIWFSQRNLELLHYVSPSSPQNPFGIELNSYIEENRHLSNNVFSHIITWLYPSIQICPPYMCFLYVCLAHLEKFSIRNFVILLPC